MNTFRQVLSAPGLLATVRSAFARVKDWRTTKKPDYHMVDALMSGTAIFDMKYPSLLQFDKSKADSIIASNLKNLYGVARAPSDTQLREILDPVDPNALRSVFKAVFAKLQDGKALLPFLFIDNSYLMSIDGTGYFSSHEVHCENCCVKTSREGTVTYYHQMLGAVVVHPCQRQVIPFAPEAILKQDGKTKNDCELNAAKRLLRAVRKDHPHLKITAVGDSLFSNASMLRLTKQQKMGFIFGVKPGNHESLFAYLRDAMDLGAIETLEFSENQVTHHFDFINEVPLNESNQDLLVNVLEYTETRAGKQIKFSWITGFELTKENVYQILRGGRARWRIENETFNTLKNQGYQFEHNFGHGYQNLSTVFAFLMLLVFLIDHAQELACPVFQELLKKAGQRKYLWTRIRSFFLTLIAESWQFLYECLLYGYQAFASPNTS